MLGKSLCHRSISVGIGTLSLHSVGNVLSRQSEVQRYVVNSRRLETVRPNHSVDETKLMETRRAGEKAEATASETEKLSALAQDTVAAARKKAEEAERKVVESQAAAEADLKKAEEAKIQVEAYENEAVVATNVAQTKRAMAEKAQARAEEKGERLYVLQRKLEEAKKFQLEKSLGEAWSSVCGLLNYVAVVATR